MSQKEESGETRQQTLAQRKKAFQTEFLEFLDKMPDARRPENVDKFDPLDTKLEDKVVVTERLKPMQDAIRRVVSEISSKYGDDWLRKIEEAIADYSGRPNSCDTVFALFAAYCVKYVTARFYSELTLFLALYREALNKKGWEIDEKGQRAQWKAPNELYTTVQSAEFAPDLSNPFITEYFPAMANPGGLVKSPCELVYLGMDDKRLSWMILLIKHFCSWLHINKFSEGKVEVTKGTA